MRRYIPKVGDRVGFTFGRKYGTYQTQCIGIIICLSYMQVHKMALFVDGIVVDTQDCHYGECFLIVVESVDGERANLFWGKSKEDKSIINFIETPQKPEMLLHSHPLVRKLGLNIDADFQYSEYKTHR